eukprot:CAMPEP_0172451792 /NCGR_PEP_ID=MMETSP1065-20121228/9674_1 /TAXON_ID=265537 /ORGANISM="Amphiprora paludosa, Strain CCMP125" /LENGTH=306 /DNA_ID=CAMNT_0013203763 /DNA_START=82 /DNA_END=1002 /DNA_ORIENTATION=+
MTPFANPCILFLALAVSTGKSFAFQLLPFQSSSTSTAWLSNGTPMRSHEQQTTNLFAKRRRREEEFDDFDDEEFFEDDDFDRPRRRRRANYDNLGDFQESSGLDLPSAFGRRDGWRLPESVSKALLAGVFVLGIGLGVTLDSQVNTNPKDLASRDAIDNAAPNPTLCAKLGASAMAFDQRVFVSFNPFNVYVSQADVKPACVLRESNVVPVLRSKGLINDDEVRECKMNMNTWAFVGDLNDTPQLSCVYKSQDAQNEFLSNPKLGIGEDYLDDDREKFTSTGKIIKGGGTEAQRELVKTKPLPGFD